MAREVIRLQSVVRGILAKHTGQPMEKIVRDSDRDYWMDAPQAKAYGLVDEVLARTDLVPALNGR
jgi:ATP-dependent Clp protease protease subunit